MTPLQMVGKMVASGAPADWSGPLKFLAVLTVMAVLPSILILMTSFTRIAIVLSFVRQAIGTPQIPPNLLLLSLALILTGMTMAPTLQKSYDAGVLPYSRGKLDFAGAVEQGMQPLRDFMFEHVREKELDLFVQAAMHASGGKVAPPKRREDVSTLVLVSAFATSEIRAAFEMGFVLLACFLVIDLIVASALMSMGMIMVPPTTISLPLKILVFVLADGWYLVIRSLLTTFLR